MAPVGGNVGADRGFPDAAASIEICAALSPGEQAEITALPGSSAEFVGS